MNHPLQCRCGRLKGYVSHPTKAHRGVCYCKDCQAYAHFLGKPGEVLDEMGGTDIVAALPKYVTFTQGLEFLACLSLTPSGLLRWYARCCNTPIGNTPRDPRVSYVGLAHNCLKNAAPTLESSFGPVRMRANTRSAKGRPTPMPLSTARSVFQILISIVRARLDGSYKHTPFFDRRTPVVPPTLLTKDERERVMRAA